MEEQSLTAMNEMEVDMVSLPEIQQESQSATRKNEEMVAVIESPSDVTNPPHSDTPTLNHEGILETSLISLRQETEEQSLTATIDMKVNMDSPPPEIQEQGSQPATNEEMKAVIESPSDDVTNLPTHEGMSTQDNFNSITESITNPMEAESESPSEGMESECQSTSSPEATSNMSPSPQKDEVHTESSLGVYLVCTRIDCCIATIYHPIEVCY